MPQTRRVLSTRNNAGPNKPANGGPAKKRGLAGDDIKKAGAKRPALGEITNAVS